MTVSSSGKTCVICNEDCSRKPRVKDNQGNYYCKTCHDAATEKRKHQKVNQTDQELESDAGTMEMSELSLEPTSDSEPESFNFLDDFADEHAAQAESALRIEAAAPPLVATPIVVAALSQPRSTGVIWPKVIGIPCIVFGGLGLLGILVEAVSVITPALSAGVGAESIGSFAGIAIGAALSLWQLQGGLGVLRQQEAGANTLRRWAYTMTFIYGTCGSFILVMASMAANSDRGDVEIGAMSLRITGFVVLAFALWPLFVAIWLSRGTIKTEINHWD